MARKISVRIDRETLEKLDMIAAAQGINRSQLIREALRLLLEEMKEKEGRGRKLKVAQR